MSVSLFKLFQFIGFQPESKAGFFCSKMQGSMQIHQLNSFYLMFSLLHFSGKYWKKTLHGFALCGQESPSIPIWRQNIFQQLRHYHVCAAAAQPKCRTDLFVALYTTSKEQRQKTAVEQKNILKTQVTKVCNAAWKPLNVHSA